MSCSFIGAFVYRAGHWAAFGVIFSIDAITSIGAMVPPCRPAAPPHRRAAAPPHRRTLAPLHLQVFLSGPRKYCSGIFTNGPGRALLGLTYWGCILLTIGLCFIPANVYLIMLCIGVQKLFWALNLAASCGCLCTAATAPSTEKASGARAQTAAGPRSTAEIELVPKAL